MPNLSFLTTIPLLAFICYVIILVILYSSRNNKLARFYMYYIIAMVVWSFGSFMMKVDLNHSLFWNRILVLGMISITPLFYHFTLFLTSMTDRKAWRNIGYVLWFFLMIANFSGLIITDAYMLVDKNRFVYELGPLAPVMAIAGVWYSILAFVNVLSKVRSKDLPFRKVKLILFGVCCVVSGGLLNLVPAIGQYPLDIILNTVNAVFIAYSIYRYKFLEITYIVRRGLSYTVYTFIFSGVYVLMIIGSQQLVMRKLGFTGGISTVMVAFFLAMILEPFRSFIQGFIDRIFNREKINHQKILRDYSQVVTHILDLDEFVQALKKVIQHSVEPKSVYLLLKEENDYFSLYQGDKNQDKKIPFHMHHPIIKWFKQGKPYLTVSKMENTPFFTSLWSNEKELFKLLNTELIVPIISRDEVTGLLMLSEKQNGEAYTRDEIELIQLIMNHSAVVVENAKMYDLAKRQAITDGLTKLHNHRYFHETLYEYLNDHSYQTFTLAMIDIDLFKFYNDLYGHSAGDKALLKIADVLKANSRDEDIVVRYGGEEFAIIFPELVEKEAYKAIERIRKAVENAFNSQDDTVSEFITISSGIASYPKDGNKVEELVEKADEALYVAKQTGRNKSVIYVETVEDEEENEEKLNLKEMQERIKSAYLSSIYALAATIDAKDRYTFGHSENVSNLAVLLAEHAGLPDKQLEIIKNAGLLHDVGKIGIPENILTKPDRLTDEEYEIMKSHVDISITIIKHVPNLVEVIPAIMSHHERFDGMGYPRGLRGENIPIEGRCLAIVDSFDAMITDRPYRKALKVEEAINELIKYKGTQFDAKLVDLFVELVETGKLDELTFVNRY
jgi:diguanylate cyclase (GGDEF)-like protein/putative nucleotidyltransferase with HDIG domain